MASSGISESARGMRKYFHFFLPLHRPSCLIQPGQSSLAIPSYATSFHRTFLSSWHHSTHSPLMRPTGTSEAFRLHLCLPCTRSRNPLPKYRALNRHHDRTPVGQAPCRFQSRIFRIPPGTLTKSIDMAGSIYVLYPSLRPVRPVHNHDVHNGRWWLCQHDLGLGYHLSGHVVRDKLTSRDNFGLSNSRRSLLSDLRAFAFVV